MQHVHINRLGVNSIEFDNDIVSIPLNPGDEHSFEIILINYGSPTYVHLSADKSLEENITFLEEKPYVMHEEYVPVIARIPPGGRLMNSGQIYVTVGYGSRKAGFRVDIGSSVNDEIYIVDDEDEPEFTGTYQRAPGMRSCSAMNLSGIYSRFVSGLSDAAFLRFILIFLAVSVAFILLYLLYQSDLGLLSQFYQAVFLSIVFTSIISYVLIRFL